MAISALDKVGVIRLWAKSKALIPTAMAAADAEAVADGSTPSGTDGYLTLKGLASYDAEITKATPTQADWEDENTASLAYIRNKPSLPDLPIDELKSLFAYGVQYDITVSDPALTRIGNMELHKTLPIQSKIRGCLLEDDGTIYKYLDPNNWTSEVRDGSKGMVMVELPEHYRKFETDGNIYRCWLSEYPLQGFHRVPKVYVSAYEAALDRTHDKLASVVNTTAQYRGGNNQSEWDNTYRSVLGRPVSRKQRSVLRTYARSRNTDTTEWNIYVYDAHKTLTWLFCVEYATRNTQAEYNPSLTVEGYHQGGLGLGVAGFPASSLSDFNDTFPFIPCGHTDSLGNQTGVVSYDVFGENNEVIATFDVPRYRGVENPYGHLHKFLDGLNVRVGATVAHGGDGTTDAYVCSDPSLFTDTGYDNYTYLGKVKRGNHYIRLIMGGVKGEIIPDVLSSISASSSTFFCDYYADSTPTTQAESLRTLCVGGGSTSASSPGLFAFSNAYSVVSSSASHKVVTTRLTFVPDENREITDWSKEYLTFFAREDAQFSFTKRGSGEDIQYCIDNGVWTYLPSDELTPVVKKGHNIKWRARIVPNKDASEIEDRGPGTFSSTGDYDAAGNPMSLLYADWKTRTTIAVTYAFAHLFRGDAHLVNTDKISLCATSMIDYCYYNMFRGCTSLITTPICELKGVYYGFAGMFQSCTHLVDASNIKIIYLKPTGTTCREMFRDCISLKKSVKIMVTGAIPKYSLYRMHFGCSALEEVTMLGTDVSATSCLYQWMYNVPATGTFYKNSTMQDIPSGSSGIPSGWTVVDVVVES